MADETPVVSPDSPGESAPAPQEVERARESFERVAERAGLEEPSPAPERPAQGVQTPGTRDPRDARPPDPGKADQEFHARQQRRHEEQREARLLAAMERVAQQAAREAEVEEGATGAAPVAEDNPFDPNTEYFEWEKWNRDALLRSFEERLDQRLSPLNQLLEEGNRRRQAEAEQRQLLARQEEQRSYMHGIARDAHETYLLDPESAGYMDRVTWMVGHDGHPGDPARGIPAVPPQDGALTLGFLAAFPNLPEREARMMARRHVDGMMQVAQQYNAAFPHAPVNPARALDLFTRVQIAAALQFAGGGAPVGNGNGNGGQPAPAPPSPAQARVKAAKDAAASGIAGSGADGGVKGGDDLAGFLKHSLSSGKKLGVQDMRRLAIRFYGKANAQALGRLARDIARAEGELRGGA